MGISFQPPEWLLQEYFNQPTKWQQASVGLQTGLKNYLDIDEAKRRNETLKREMDLRQQEQALKGREQFFKYGDPTGLPPEIAQSIGQPAQGPVTEQGAPPAMSPVLQAFNDFQSKYPQGTEGAKLENQTDTLPIVENGQVTGFQNVQRSRFGRTLNPYGGKGALDQKKTFQLKGVLDGPNGEKIPVSYDTRTGEMVKGEPISGGVQPVVSPTIPSDQTNKTAELGKFLKDIEYIKQTKKPEYIGMVDSRLTSAKQYTGVGAKTEAGLFKSVVGGLRNKVLNLLSGAAISPAEAERLMATLPDEAKSETDFDAKVANFERETRLIMEERAKSFGSAGYRNASTMAPGAGPSSGPAVGEIRKGYRFKGGNPSDPGSWEKL